MFRRALCIICLWISIFAISPIAFAQFTTPAPHAVIMDHNTGKILYKKDADAPMAPASMTKIMTVDMVFEALKMGQVTMDTEFQVSEEAWRRGGVKSGSSTMFLDVNSLVRVEDLLRGAIIQSGNDACIALAEGLVGSEEGFAARMTARAKQLGLSSASFKNSTGWPHPEHAISAADLAKLARHQIKSYPEYYPLYAENDFSWNGIKQANRNPLLGRINGADGMKTGSTEASGYGLVGTAIRDGKRRIIVINGLNSKAERASVSRSLMEAAFTQFQIFPLYQPDQTVAEIDVYMGTAETVPVTLKEAVSVGLHVTEREAVTSRVEYTTPAAPITAGDQVAEMIITAPGRKEVRYPLYAAQDVKAKSIFAKAWAVLLQKIRG